MCSDRSRRDALHLSGVALAGFAGCLDDSATTNSTPDSAPSSPATAGAGCGEDLEPFPKTYDEIEYGRLGDFELIAEPNTVALGADTSFTLRWVSGDDDNPPVTGNAKKFTVERETGDGWRSIYHVHERRPGWTDIGAAPPGSSPPTTWFDWSFTLTQQGMEQSSEYNPSYTVCNSLQPGSYRFVYWGVSPPQEKESDWETEYAIGVTFRVTE